MSEYQHLKDQFDETAARQKAQQEAPLREEIAALKAEVGRLSGLRPKYPPMQPDGEGMPRYGLRWNGPTTPVAVPMDDGYWTPWHLAQGALAAVVSCHHMGEERPAWSAWPARGTTTTPPSAASPRSRPSWSGWPPSATKPCGSR